MNKQQILHNALNNCEKPEDLNLIIAILQNATKEEVHSAFQDILDGRKIIEEERYLRDEKYKEHEKLYLSQIDYCLFCHKPGIRAEMLWGETSTISHHWFHEDCYSIWKSEHSLTCFICGRSFRKKEQLATWGLCKLCGDAVTIKELKRVQTQIHRARNHGVEATLTLLEWLDTIRHFENMCAYCEKAKFSVMDHFIPLSMGGGTTKKNCVPACQHCNSIKCDKPPDPIGGLFEKQVLKSGRYLGSR